MVRSISSAYANLFSKPTSAIATRRGRFSLLIHAHAVLLPLRCTTNPYRQVARWIDEAVLDRMETRLKANPEILRQRREIVEHPFGSIKQWMNQGAFLMRGLVKVRAEFSLTALAYNMTRVLTIVGIERLLKAFQNATNHAFSSSLFVFCRAHGETSPLFHELSTNIINTLNTIVIYTFGLIEFSHGLDPLSTQFSSMEESESASC